MSNNINITILQYVFTSILSLYVILYYLILKSVLKITVFNKRIILFVNAFVNSIDRTILISILF